MTSRDLSRDQLAGWHGGIGVAGERRPAFRARPFCSSTLSSGNERRECRIRRRTIIVEHKSARATTNRSVFRDIGSADRWPEASRFDVKLPLNFFNGFFSAPSNVESSDGRGEWGRTFWLWSTRLRKFAISVVLIALVGHSAKLVEVSSIGMKLSSVFESLNVSRASGVSSKAMGDDRVVRSTMYVASRSAIVKYELVVSSWWTDRYFLRYSYSVFLSGDDEFFRPTVLLNISRSPQSEIIQSE